MIKRLVGVLAPVLLIAACSDGVPHVEDPHNIVINSQKMTQTEFLNEFCVGKSQSETCAAVLQAKRHDSTRGEMPKW